MTTKKPLVTVNITEQQQTALARATLRAQMTASEARRLALKLFCEQYGVVWPDDMTPHGGDRKSGTSQMKCGWCGHLQFVRSWDEECAKCGECKFIEIK